MTTVIILAALIVLKIIFVKGDNSALEYSDSFDLFDDSNTSKYRKL